MLKSKQNNVTFNGKNAKDIKSFLKKHGVDLNQESNGKISVVIDGKEKIIFKDDVVSIKGKKVVIIKPNYTNEKAEIKKG